MSTMFWLGVRQVILAKGWRWLAYILFFMVCIGGIAALSRIWASSPVPGWLCTGIVCANWLCARALFLALWKTPQRGMEV